LEYAEREREIVRRLHSRERLAWSGWVAGVCSLLLGDHESAERELNGAIALAKAIGERRLLPLLTTWHAVLLANVGRFNEALSTALDTFEQAERLGLLYLRTEAHRGLAHVRFRRGEIDEAIRLCETVHGLLEGKDAKVSRLWMGPLHVEALVAAGRNDEARARLAEYSAVVESCQSPFFTRELARLSARLA